MRHYVLRVSVSYLMMPKQRKWVCVVQNSIACGSLSTNEPDNSLSTSFLTYGFVVGVVNGRSGLVAKTEMVAPEGDGQAQRVGHVGKSLPSCYSICGC